MEKIVVLNSGGFDSTVLLAFLNKEYPDIELHSLYFSYGQLNDLPTSNVAKLNADKYCKSHRVIKLPKIDWTKGSFFKPKFVSEKGQYLEARNLIFASYAVSLAESIKADTIAMALIKDGVNFYPDTSTKFSKKMDRLCNVFGLQFMTPFINCWKFELRDMALEYGIESDSFFSCDVPIKGKPCGKCPDCINLKSYIEEFKNKG